MICGRKERHARSKCMSTLMIRRIFAMLTRFLLSLFSFLNEIASVSINHLESFIIQANPLQVRQSRLWLAGAASESLCRPLSTQSPPHRPYPDRRVSRSEHHCTGTNGWLSSHVNPSVHLWFSVALMTTDRVSWSVFRRWPWTSSVWRLRVQWQEWVATTSRDWRKTEVLK